jgi:hypothetical protein
LNAEKANQTGMSHGSFQVLVSLEELVNHHLDEFSIAAMSNVLSDEFKDAFT